MKRMALFISVFLGIHTCFLCADAAIHRSKQKIDRISAASEVPKAGRIADIIVDTRSDGARIILIGDGTISQYRATTILGKSAVALEVEGVRPEIVRKVRITNTAIVKKIDVVPAERGMRMVCTLSEKLGAPPTYAVVSDKLKLQLYVGKIAERILAEQAVRVASKQPDQPVREPKSDTLPLQQQTAVKDRLKFMSNMPFETPIVFTVSADVRNAGPEVMDKEVANQFAALNMPEGVYKEAAREEECGFVDNVPDPLEKWNRWMFKFNDKFYFWVFKPAAKGYNAVVPEGGRTAMKNFFYNVTMPIRFINDILQGKPQNAGKELGAFVINSTLGLGGLFEVARKDDPELDTPAEDFGQTLAVYGIGHGAYIVWPIIGPSSVRDTVGLVGDSLIHPASRLIPSTPGSIGAHSYEYFNEGSLRIGNYEDILKASLDPYTAIKDAYIQHRNHESGR